MDEMDKRDKNFKTSILGGFNRQDVVDAFSTVSESYTDNLAELKAQLRRLEDEKIAVQRSNYILKSKAIELERLNKELLQQVRQLEKLINTISKSNYELILASAGLATDDYTLKEEYESWSKEPSWEEETVAEPLPDIELTESGAEEEPATVAAGEESTAETEPQEPESITASEDAVAPAPEYAPEQEPEVEEPAQPEGGNPVAAAADKTQAAPYFDAIAAFESLAALKNTPEAALKLALEMFSIAEKPQAAPVNKAPSEPPPPPPPPVSAPVNENTAQKKAGARDDSPNMQRIEQLLQSIKPNLQDSK